MGCCLSKDNRKIDSTNDGIINKVRKIILKINF